ncbi:hypothetical protein [Pseudomonas sp. H3(2019)]|uniref:hypothetical protein n=1 Tax=Pseudomonas sp. H3(2019) TaxID=2598724 RepID=UPI00119340EA|nr:hypothetical protein [Pseudomonas sp. H3(2019)]TVT86037.1 hypothetical protein FPT12_03335 [Pseudomonas sp. H3(2019)]
MPLKNKKLAAVMSCVLMLAAAPLLPAELSIMGTAYAKEGGGHGGGNGGGNGGGSGSGNGGSGGAGAHAGEGHSASAKSDGRAEGQEADHDGRAVRDHGLSGKHIGRDRDNHVGRDRDDHRGHGAVTSGIAHSKATRGVAKATAISATTPGDHNAKGLSKAVTSTTDKIR